MTLTEKFESIGARLRYFRSNVPTSESYSLDVGRDRLGEHFTFTEGNSRSGVILKRVEVLDAQKKDRHLLLMVNDTEGMKRYLCGHDERHWFVAPVSGGASTVFEAKEQLKPVVVQLVQERAGVKRKDLGKHKTKGWIRQGEWFFVPRPDFKPKAMEVIRNEPLRRGVGKPHMAEYCCRYGGEVVYVNPTYAPNGITERQMRVLFKQNREAQKRGWRSMMRNSEVYVMGKIRHPDHKTTKLASWHQVIPSREDLGENVAFLD